MAKKIIWRPVIFLMSFMSGKSPDFSCWISFLQRCINIAPWMRIELAGIPISINILCSRGLLTMSDKITTRNKTKQVAKVKTTNCKINFIRSGIFFWIVIFLPSCFVCDQRGRGAAAKRSEDRLPPRG